MATSALLQQIQAGKALKKATTNDRSTPIVDAKPVGGGGGAIRMAPSASGSSTGAGGGGGGGAFGGGPQLGGLFANGMPKLKPAQSSPGEFHRCCDAEM